MEQSWFYKDYGITYYEIGGTTVVHDGGVEVRRFKGLGYLAGKEAAEKWVDEFMKLVKDFSPTEGPGRQ